MTADFHVVPGLRMHGAVPLYLPHMLHGMQRDIFTVTNYLFSSCEI